MVERVEVHHTDPSLGGLSAASPLPGEDLAFYFVISDKFLHARPRPHQRARNKNRINLIPVDLAGRTDTNVIECKVLLILSCLQYEPSMKGVKPRCSPVKHHQSHPLVVGLGSPDHIRSFYHMVEETFPAVTYRFAQPPP